MEFTLVSLPIGTPLPPPNYYLTNALEYGIVFSIMKIKPQYNFIYAGLHANVWGHEKSYEMEWGETCAWDVYMERVSLRPRWHHDGLFREGSKRNVFTILGNYKNPFRASYEFSENKKEHISNDYYYFTLEEEEGK